MPKPCGLLGLFGACVLMWRGLDVSASAPERPNILSFFVDAAPSPSNPPMLDPSTFETTWHAPT